MKRRGKKRLPGIGFILILGIILFLTFTNIFGVNTRFGDVITPVVKSASEIRFGIDIRGGVDVSFVPADDSNATETQMDAAQAVIEQRLVSLSITDYELYKDYDRSRLILRFPWRVGETDFNPESAIQELATTAMLTFREGSERDETSGAPTGITEEKVILEGNDVESATVQYGPVSNSSTGQNNQYFIALKLTPEGLQKFSQATSDIVASDSVSTMSIWMDDNMISAPSVTQRIDSDPIITGGGEGFKAEDAKKLADQINSGALPFALSAESYSTISPTLGNQSLRAMVIAGILAFILVAGFMIFNYRLPGFVASIALGGQVMMTLALISGYFAVFQGLTTLTLPGIAGIILSVGMGVDANVITGERIKEELRNGKKLDNAIKSGFQRGFSPIIDSNMTVLIVAVMLMGAFGPPDSFLATILKPIFFMFGPTTAGNIYSFGVTLAIGVVLNLVFGVVANRVMLTSLSKIKALRKPVLYGGLREGKTAPPPSSLNVVGNRRKFFAGSSLIIVAIIVLSFVLGVQLDVQFKGGAILTYSYTGNIETADAQDIVDEHLGDGATLQVGTNPTTGANTLTITMPGTETVDAAKVEELTTAFNEEYDTQNFEQLELNNINPTIGREFLAKCIVALMAASLLLLAYIAYRFRKIGGWLGGCTAVIALLHDLIMIYGVFVILGIPLSGNFIAALLTILGYSINDTVVIYDRVRENRELYGKKKSFAELVNLSINQSLRRSVNTTVTTLIALACVCIFAIVYNLTSIFTFVFPLMIGMLSGVYSSVCIAGPLWVMLEGGNTAKLKKTAAKNSSSSTTVFSAGSKNKNTSENKSEKDSSTKTFAEKEVAAEKDTTAEPEKADADDEEAGTTYKKSTAEKANDDKPDKEPTPDNKEIDTEK